MSRSVRLVVFAVAGAALAALLALAFLRMPAFGGSAHQYRDHAVAGAVRHATANVVSAVNFDQRGLDTLGEETILLGSVIGAAVLLRPTEEEERREPESTSRTLQSTVLAGYLFLGTTLLLGVDLVTHGHVTPGGGFQGGVVLATGYHLLYVAGRFPALVRLRPEVLFEVGEAAGAAAFGGLAMAGIGVAGSFLANVLPSGSFGDLLSSGSVPLLNVAVGVEVACGTVILLARFLEQTLVIRRASPE